MSVVEERLDAILHDLEDLPAEQVAEIFRQLLQPSQADFAQALRVFVHAALTTDAEVERLAGEPKDVRGESDRLLRDQRIKAEAHAGVLDQDFLDSSGWASRWARVGSTSAKRPAIFAGQVLWSACQCVTSTSIRASRSTSQRPASTQWWRM